MSILVMMMLRLRSGTCAARLETKEQMLAFLRAHPSRAYFSRLMRDGPYDVAMEVGVADGRFSEHFLVDGQPKAWYMVESFPNEELQARYPASTSGRRAPRRQLEEIPTSWASRGIGTTSRLRFFKAFSLDKAVIKAIAPESFDFVYLDGAHDYANVALELEPYYRMLRPGGMLAGHDYCKYDERPLACRGCADVPACVTYTEYGVRHGKGDRRAANQWGVVKAVQEWLVRHPELEVYHTTENFTRTSLAQDGMDYDLVITNTYNPSWYVFKPESGTPAQSSSASGSPLCGAVVVDKSTSLLPRLGANLACPSRFEHVQRLPNHASDLTVAYLYYRDTAYLERHVNHWVTLPRDLLKRISILIVDDCSPMDQSARAVLEKMRDCDVRAAVVRVGEDIKWNIGGARNLAFALAPTELVLLVDADQLVTQSLLEWSLRHSKYALARCDIFLDFPRKFPNDLRHRVHPATILTSRSSYWRVGGCDEDFVGNYGFTDVHFAARLRQTPGCRRISSERPIIEHVANFTDAMALEPAPPLIHLERSHSSHDIAANKAILRKKFQGQLPWSTDYLRFSWEWVFGADGPAKCRSR